MTSKPYRMLTTQLASYTASSAQTSNAFDAGVQVIRVISTTNCHIRIGTNPTAVSTDPLLIAATPEYFLVAPGEKLAAIRSASDGSVFVTECSL
jgi:hypothetical protein